MRLSVSGGSVKRTIPQAGTESTDGRIDINDGYFQFQYYGHLIFHLSQFSNTIDLNLQIIHPSSCRMGKYLETYLCYCFDFKMQTHLCSSQKQKTIYGRYSSFYDNGITHLRDFQKIC